MADPKPVAPSDEYTTEAVESHPDMWTAKISRTGVNVAGAPETFSGLISVGSISHLLKSSILAAKTK